MLFENSFKDKTVLVTGHTGFKGSWLCIWLRELGAQVVGYALEPYTDRDNFVVAGLGGKITHIVGDIRDYQKLEKAFSENRPEFVFHLAAQPIVRESYLKPKETFDSNIGGTVNVLECCRSTDSVKVIVNVTSDKCYENREWVWGYRESDPMGGYDPYSSSKGCSELITKAYLKSFFNPDDFEAHRKCLSSARAGKRDRRRGLAEIQAYSRLHQGIGEQSACQSSESDGHTPLAARAGNSERLSLSGEQNVQGTRNLFRCLEFWARS